MRSFSRADDLLFALLVLVVGCAPEPFATDGDLPGTDTSDGSDSEPTTDEPVPTTNPESPIYCLDEDGDGYGDPTQCTEVPPGEEPPSGAVDNDDDCSDDAPNIFPGAAPNDSVNLCMKDRDGDDWGDIDLQGGGGPGDPQPGTDCDDERPNAFPGAAPNDSLTACMKDDDDDDFGDEHPPGSIEPGTDCDDSNASVVECTTCNDADGDGWFGMCDGPFPPDRPFPDCDDADPNTFPGAAPNDDPDACMTDADDDDFGDDTPAHPDAVPGTDCDDKDPSAFPGAAPLDDPNACMVDRDDDDHGDADPDAPDVTPGADCNDEQDAINPTDSVLITAQLTTGEILEVDLGTGALTPIAQLDTTGFDPWSPVSVTVDPNDLTVLASLAAQPTLVAMNYCGGGVPAPLPQPHNLTSLCAISFDRDGVLWGVDGMTDELLRFAADGSVAEAVALTADGDPLDILDCGMTWDCHQSRLLLSDTGEAAIYTVDTATGVATRLAELQSDPFGAGLAYEPVSMQALSCSGVAFYAISLDGTNQFTKLADLMSAAAVDDLEFMPGCQ